MVINGVQRSNHLAGFNSAIIGFIRAKLNAVLAILSLAVCTLLYIKGLNGPFILDDFHNIHNAFNGTYSFDKFREVVFNNQSGLLGRPISMASLYITGWMHGVNAWAFKLHNLIIHLVNGLLVLTLTFKLAKHSETFEKTALHFALFVMTIWLLMPMQVSTVLYPVQRMAQLSTLFILATLVATAFAIEATTLVKRDAVNSKKFTLYLLLIPSLMLLAVFSKENGILVIPLMGLVFLFYKDKLSKLDKVFFVTYSALPVIIGIVGFFIFSDKFLNYKVRTFTLSDRLLTQVDVIWYYLYVVIVPDIRKMSFVLDDFPIRTAIDFLWCVKFTGLLAAMAASIYYLFKKSLVALGILLFFVGHALESTALPLEIAFEHRNYLPSIGITIALVGALQHLGANKFSKHIKYAYIIVLAVALFFRVDSWSSEAKLYLSQLENRPFSKRAAAIYANYLFESQDFQGALNQAARGMHPEYAGFYLSEILMVSQLQAFDPKLITIAVEKLNSNKIDGYQLSSLTSITSCKLNNFCQFITFDQLEALLNKAETISIREGGAWLGYIYLNKARMFYKQQEFEQAEGFYLKAFQVSREPVMIVEMIGALWNGGYKEKARKYLTAVEDGQYFSVANNKDRIKKIQSAVAKK